MSSQDDKAQAARAAHRFLVKGLVAIAILAVALGAVVGWIRPSPVVPVVRSAEGTNLE